MRDHPRYDAAMEAVLRGEGGAGEVVGASHRAASDRDHVIDGLSGLRLPIRAASVEELCESPTDDEWFS